MYRYTYVYVRLSNHFGENIVIICKVTYILLINYMYIVRVVLVEHQEQLYDS